MLIAGLVITMSPGDLESQTVPENARRVGDRWVCNNGYFQRGNACVHFSAATDSEVRQILVSQSIVRYSGNCPCPFNVDRAGRRCGGRSAYSRPGGASPLCYESDVSTAAVARFRQQYPPPQ